MRRKGSRVGVQGISRATPGQMKASARKKRVRAERRERLATEAAALNITPAALKFRKAQEWAATKRRAVSEIFPDMVRPDLWTRRW